MRSPVDLAVQYVAGVLLNADGRCGTCEDEKVRQLQRLIKECNRKGNLHIQLVTDEPNAFPEAWQNMADFPA